MTTLKKPDSDAKRLKRVNPTLPTHAFKANPLLHLVPPAQISFRGADIYDGKELRPFTSRPGAMDFKKCPSRGLST